MFLKTISAFIFVFLSMPVFAQTGAGKIVFTSNRTGNDDIFIMKPDGSEQTNLTNNPLHDSSPAWSPDGRKIAFVRYDGNSSFDIYTMNIDGSNQARLTNAGTSSQGPSWSPDGTKIIFIRFNQIFVMNANGTDQHQLSFHSGIDLAPKFSPDGAQIVYYCYRRARTKICTMNADGTNELMVTNEKRVDNFPMFSPDGSKILFTRNGRDANEFFDDDIWVMNADGSNRTNLSNLYNTHSSRGEWSPDGSMIVFHSNRDGANNYNIYVMFADGTHQAPLTTNTAHDTEPTWRIPAPAAVSGRITDGKGNGIFNAYVTLTGAGGFVRTVSTDTSGYYRFEGVEVAETYTFSVAAKRRTFNQPEQVRSIIGDTDDVNFTAGN